jgi:DNA-binding NarL/FixJ family response regulator
MLTLLFYLYRQTMRLVLSQRNLAHLNESLTQLNGELQSANEKLRESDKVKEAYIGHYLDLCSVYISKMEKYRIYLSKVARNDGTKALLDTLRSEVYLDEELREFYNGFDKTFLHLYPDFVEQFNALLRSEAHITPKHNRLLNTELRIFALIRLGIGDTGQIASFLRCSSSTIYNYRSNIRNSATVEPNRFENEVMKIERVV